jgi:hypothetical protein
MANHRSKLIATKHSFNQFVQSLLFSAQGHLLILPTQI